MAGSPAATTTYGYDPAGYLDQVSTGAASVTYETDARGLRQVRDTGVAEDFLWSTVGLLPLLVADESNFYVYGPGSVPLAQIARSSGDITYLHADDLGSVRLTTDGAGQMLGAQTFSEFGSLLWASGAVGTPFGFTGNWTDPVTGLVHLRARDYDPQTGQFLSVDPALDDTRQPYTYAGNNPVQFTDHTGLDFWEDAAAIDWGSVATDALGGALAFGAGAYDNLTWGLFGTVERAIYPGYDCFIDSYSASYITGDVTATVAGVVAANPVAVGRVVVSTVRGVGRAAVAGSRRVVKAITKSSTKTATNGGAAVVRMGQAGESAVRSAFDIGPKATRVVNGRTRIFDGLNSGAGLRRSRTSHSATKGQLDLRAAERAAPRLVRPRRGDPDQTLGSVGDRDPQRRHHVKVHPMTRDERCSGISATDLMTELENDPEYQRKMAAAEAERQERVRRLREAEQPIVADLRAAGVQVDSVWDLVNTAEPYPAALPVLMEHLERGGYPERVMESLGRALAVKPSVAFWERLKARWLDARDPGEEDGAAVALAACATKEQLDDLIEFLSIEARGQSRIYFIRPILKLGGDRGREVVDALRIDPVFGKEASALLKRRRR